MIDDKAFEIQQSPITCKKVHEMSNKYLPSTKSFTGTTGIVCGLDGVEVVKKARGKALYNCPYTNGNVVYLKCQECEDRICEKGWFFCGVGGTPLSMTKSRMQMSEYLDKMLAKREKVVIVAESGKKMTALAAMYASERGYSFISVANDDLPTYLAKQQQKGCVMFDGAENEREIENTCRELHIPLRHCKLEEK